jgi:F-type H+-transporting ATPase subunit delta
MISGSLAKRYARALFELGGNATQRDRYLRDLENLRQATKVIPEQGPGVVAAMDAAHIPVVRRTAIAKALCKRLGCDDTVGKFIALLVERGRITGLPLIVRHYRDMVDEAANRVRATVLTPKPLASDARGRIENALKKATGKSVILEPEVDPELIGGIVTRIGSYTLDGSVRSSLATLRKSLQRS